MSKKTIGVAIPYYKNSEECDFSHTVIDLTKHRKRNAKTKYYYQLGANPNSLTMKYKRNEIGERR